VPLFPLPDLSSLGPPPAIPTAPGTDFQEAFGDSDAAYSSIEFDLLSAYSSASSALDAGNAALSVIEGGFSDGDSEYAGILSDLLAVDYTAQILAGQSNDSYIAAGLLELAGFSYSYSLPDEVPGLSAAPTDGSITITDWPTGSTSTGTGSTGGSVNPPPPDTCPEGEQQDPYTGLCVPIPTKVPCGTGLIYDPTTGNCLSGPDLFCPPGLTQDPITGGCTSQGGTPASSCPDGYTYDVIDGICTRVFTTA